MTFREACIQAIEMAKEKGVIFYVYASPSLWDIRPNHDFTRQWLFKVYPGGRAMFSTEGSTLLTDTAPKVS